MGQCAGIKRDGSRCSASVPPGVAHCYNHDPTRADERRRNATRAGRRRPNTEISEIKDLLKELTARVTFVEGSEYLPANHAAVAAQLINTRLRAIELERKIREQEEFIERLEALERAAAEGQRGGRWGA